jgi:hypothetical protein
MTNVLQFLRKVDPILHCPKCKRSVPTFDDMLISTTSETSAKTKILSVTIHIECQCGQLLDLRKVKR